MLWQIEHEETYKWFFELAKVVYLNEHPEFSTFVKLRGGELHFDSELARARFARGLVELSADPLRQLYSMNNWLEPVQKANQEIVRYICPFCLSELCPVAAGIKISWHVSS